jgi:hypothetical protein
VQAEAKKQVPEKAITAKQLSQVEPPPSQKKTMRSRVIVYRATEVETVTP